jgi:hypothetical protein
LFSVENNISDGIDRIKILQNTIEVTGVAQVPQPDREVPVDRAALRLLAAAGMGGG